MIRRLIARTYWLFSRYSYWLDPSVDPARPAVIVAAPHTSNWDFVLMLAIAWRAGINLRWMGKAPMFRGLAGPIMRSLGGIAVDRANPQGLVDDVVARLQRGETFSLVITPEGTRGRTEYWKSGFYRIATQTHLPVTLGYVDKTTMVAGLGLTFELTGDVGADMDVIRAFYADKSGIKPHLRVEPKLRMEDEGGGGAGPGGGVGKPGGASGPGADQSRDGHA